VSDGELPNPPDEKPLPRSDPWTDLGLTLPIFVVYHLGVVFLPVRNAADPVTMRLRELANYSVATYALFTLLIGALFVGVLAVLGRGKALSGWRFALVACEGLVYAAALRFAASYLLGALPLSAPASAAPAGASSVEFTGVIMSLGAGFYEEIAFRVLLFGSGSWIVGALMEKGATEVLVKIGWAAVTAILFSAWHYTGALGDAFDARSFVYRAICGFLLATVYAFRGFAPAVWTHALYDVWALVLAG
jgi:hypothetical protein